MSAVVGIDVGAYKHAAAVCRTGERKPSEVCFSSPLTAPGSTRWTAGSSAKVRSSVWCWSQVDTITGRWPVTSTGEASGWR